MAQAESSASGRVEILDCTLRDGSYAVNFSFTSRDTAVLCRELEACGVKWIEVGHGVGFNAASMGMGEAAESDAAYLEAAAGALRTAKFGAFCIPGVARLSDLDMAAGFGMGFVRVGTNVTEVASGRPFIERARQHGMFVCANFMKSYAMEPREFAAAVCQAEEYGAQMVYVVDSAGGMFPETVRSYVKASQDVSSIQLGFHGHDNLRLSVANSLAAVEAGCSWIDGSLQGLGRSSGNAPTEILVGALAKRGYETGVDFLRVLALGHSHVQPLITATGAAVLDVVSGYAEFHSSYMHHIMEAAAKYGVSPAALIVEVCKVDRVQVDRQLVECVAKTLPVQTDLYLGRYGFGRYRGAEQDERR